MATPMTKNDSDAARYAAGPAPRSRLILIDESRVFSASAREIAEDLGYQVQTANRIGEVMQACRLEPPEIVLIGHISPDVDGLELIAWLCEDSSVARLLVLTDGTKRYSDARRLVAKWGGSLAVEAHPRPLGSDALRAALARKPLTKGDL